MMMGPVGDDAFDPTVMDHDMEVPFSEMLWFSPDLSVGHVSDAVGRLGGTLPLPWATVPLLEPPLEPLLEPEPLEVPELPVWEPLEPLVPLDPELEVPELLDCPPVEPLELPPPSSPNVPVPDPFDEFTPELAETPPDPELVAEPLLPLLRPVSPPAFEVPPQESVPARPTARAEAIPMCTRKDRFVTIRLRVV
jgi:hypothetical protein